jgi:hypothetical protein
VIISLVLHYSISVQEAHELNPEKMAFQKTLFCMALSAMRKGMLQSQI